MYAQVEKNEEAMLMSPQIATEISILLNPTPVVLFPVRPRKLASVNFADKMYK